MNCKESTMKIHGIHGCNGRRAENGLYIYMCMDVSKNRGGPHKKCILIGFSIIFTIHFGVPLFLETLKSFIYNHYLDVPLEVGINGDRISGLFHLRING